MFILPISRSFAQKKIKENKIKSGENESRCENLMICCLVSSEQVSGPSFFLVEAVVDVTTKMLKIVTKVEDSSLVQEFDEHLRTSLEGDWIETK